MSLSSDTKYACLDADTSCVVQQPQQVFIDVEQHEMSDRDLEMNINFDAVTINEIRTTANALDIPTVSVTTHFSGNASDSDGSTIHGVLQRDYA